MQLAKVSQIHIFFIAITQVTYFSDGRRLSYDEMKLRCASRKSRLCYYDELCPNGGPNKPPVGGQQSTNDMWAPIVNSPSDPTPNWIQIGQNKAGLCSKIKYYETANRDGSWMVTNMDVSWKEIYPCCPKGEFEFICISNGEIKFLFNPKPLSNLINCKRIQNFSFTNPFQEP